MRAIKKIIALATGATMVGATIMGAMAASLADYPSPLLIKDTTFDADIVYGARADPSDVMGLVDAVAAISVIETGQVIEGAGEEIALEGDSWKVETSSKKLEIGEDFTSIQSSIGADELNALADGTFKAKNTANYEQEIKFGDKLKLLYEEDTDEEKVGVFVTLDNNDPIVNYTLTFKTAAETDIDTSASGNELEDFKDQTIKILGEEYTMTKVSYSSPRIELTLMGGAILDVLEQGQVKTYTLNGKDYEVEVTYIGTDKVKFKVNGQTTDSLYEGDTWTLADGTDIGVREVLEEEAGEVTADQVEFYLGANKIVLSDDNVTDSTADGKMNVGEERMDEVGVMIKGSESGGDFLLESIRLVYTADDDYWLAAGEKLSENLEEPQSMINWDIAFEGMSKESTEQIDLVPSGDDRAVLKVNIADGAATIPLAYSPNNTDVRLGDKSYRLILDRDTNIVKNQYFFLTTGSGVPDSEGEKSYILQYRGADSSTGDTTATLKFKNLVTGATLERTFTIGGTGKLTLGGEEFTISNTSDASEGTDDFNISISGGADEGYIVTKGNALINITDANESDDTDNILVTITEVAPASMVESDVAGEINVTLSPGDVDEIGISAPSVSTGSLIVDPDDSDIKTQMTVYGALVKHTSESGAPDKVEITWPLKQIVGQAFVTSGAVKATIVGGTGGAVLKRVTIPLAKSDDDVLAVDPTMTKKNYLLVGGPCANRATAKVMGASTSWPDCAEGFEEGVGRIILKQMNGKVSMIVAGMTALDTTRATRVLKNYKDYTLSGDEVEVLGTTATPQTVRTVSS